MFGDALRARREKLDTTVSQLFRLTGTPRSYISDCESGRKFPSRQWVERLAGMDPEDEHLLTAYHEAAFERIVATKWPASHVTTQLARQLASAPLEPDHKTQRAGLAREVAPPLGIFRSITGRPHCLQEALALLQRAADTGPPQRKDHDDAEGDTELDAVLLVHAPSLERSDLDWRSGLRNALAAGWTVVHVANPEAGALSQIQRIRDLISLIGQGGVYIPLVLPREGSSSELPDSRSAVELVVVPGHGFLQMYGGGTAASFFPWQEPYLEACRNLARGAHEVRAKATQIVTVLMSNDPPPDAKRSTENTKKWLKPLPAKVVFDEALTDATVRGGRRALMKSGLVLATMPPYVTLKLAARLNKVATPEQLPLIENLTKNRLRRWQAIHGNETDQNQHVCTIPSLLAYLAAADEEERKDVGKLYVEHDPLFSGMELTRDDRIEHMRGVVELLRSGAQYEVGLVQSPDALPVPVGQSYWFCTQAGLFFVGSRFEKPGTRFVTIRDRAVVEGFFQVFDATWEGIPALWRNRKFVADLIEHWIDLAEKHNPMMTQPRTYAELA